MIPSTRVAYFRVILNKLDFCEQIDRASSRFNSGIFWLRRLSCFDSGDLLLTVSYGCSYTIKKLSDLFTDSRSSLYP